MSSDPLRVLLVEDSPTDAKLLIHELRRTHPRAEFERVDDELAMREALKKPGWDVIISDWSMPRFSTLGALRVLQESGLDLPFIIASATIGEEAAVQAMRAGAHDYVLKDHLARLAPAVERETRECKNRKAHRKEEARFRALIEKSADGIIVSARDGAWQYVSPAAARIFGRPHEELIGRRVVDVVYPGDRAMMDAVMAAVREAPDTMISQEFRVLHSSGAVRWVASTSRNLLGDPIIDGIVVNVRDITERRAGAEALRVSEERFIKLASSGVIGVITASLDGRILDANETYLKMVGYTLEDFSSGRVRWTDLMPPDVLDATTATTAQLMEHGVAPAFETAAVAKDGRRVPMLVGASLLDDRATTVAFCADLTDKKLTEETLRQTEEHLRQAQKMEAIGRLAGGIAHDFNNLLSVILSYSEVLLVDLAEDDAMRDDVEEIRKAGERAADLTRQLLMFSRRQVLAPRILDLNDLLAEMTKMLKRLVGEDIDLTLVRALSPARVKADPTSIEQVIMNLVVNARDAMPTGGTLTIETSTTILDEAHAKVHACKHSGPHVMLTVTDTGTGMDDPTQQRIFEPFFTTKANEKGTGLGLSTVFGIVEQSSGCVWVESVPGKGTTFKICLPLQDGQVDDIRPATSPTTSGGTETILLVEDEDQVRVVVRDILHRQGYQVIEARNAGEALLWCEKHAGPIHLLLSDVVMPQMSGPELAKRLCSMRPEMRLLFMSGYTDDSIVRHGVLNSDIAFLHKPLTPSTLARAVREVLDVPAPK